MLNIKLGSHRTRGLGSRRRFQGSTLVVAAVVVLAASNSSTTKMLGVRHYSVHRRGRLQQAVLFHNSGSQILKAICEAIMRCLPNIWTSICVGRLQPIQGWMLTTST
jgi:hypothetical protein